MGAAAGRAGRSAENPSPRADPGRLAARTGHAGARLHRQRQLRETPHPRRRLGTAQPAEAGSGTTGHDAERYVLTCGSSLLARFAVAEVQALSGKPVFLLDGGTSAWVAAGLPTEDGESLLASPRIDRYRRPYEGTDNPRRSDAGLSGLGVRPGGATGSRRNPRFSRAAAAATGRDGLTRKGAAGQRHCAQPVGEYNVTLRKRAVLLSGFEYVCSERTENWWR